MTAKNLGWAGTVPKLEYRREILRWLAWCARIGDTRRTALRDMDPGNSPSKAASALRQLEREGWVQRIGEPGQARNYVLADDVVLDPLVVEAYFPGQRPTWAQRVRLYRGQLIFEME